MPLGTSLQGEKGFRDGIWHKMVTMTKQCLLHILQPRLSSRASSRLFESFVSVKLSDICFFTPCSETGASERYQSDSSRLKHKHILLLPIMASNLATKPPQSPSFLLSYPAEYVLLVTINRERGMNSIGTVAHWEAEAIFDWYDAEPSLRVAIITGAGKKSFCAGQDLIEQGTFASGGARPHKAVARHPPGGFAGISRATHRKKPIIAAVNGYALGGGFEITLNW